MANPVGQHKVAVVGVCLAAFIGPVFLFPTLHAVHPYYNMENGVFLLFAVAAVISWLPGRCPYIVLAGTLAVMFATAEQRNDFSNINDNMIKNAHWLSTVTRPADVIIIYGMEWNPTVPYYAGRKAIMETTLADEKDVIARAKQMFNTANGYHVGAIIRCPCKWDGDPAYEEIFTRLRMGDMSHGCAVLLRPS